MSASTVIKVDGLGKRYAIRHEGSRTPYRSLRDDLVDWAAAPVRALGRIVGRRPASAVARPTSEEFWALKDVSFEVGRGEVLGIIGGNGAGKSTLLKILSRITDPTIGRVEIDGRVASLLEVGTGFHPELTGRENIFLNGAILGMTRAEIRAKFDDIVAFAEVERFLDTPVKRYSSGMYVRLAFAVAAHLEPEILVVDEVLAVGDAQFQQKCLGKMQDVSSREGRTVLFVSHQMGTVRQLCSRAVLLKEGRIIRSGSTDEVIQQYLGTRTSAFSARGGSSSRDVAIEKAWAAGRSKEESSYFVHSDEITVNVLCRLNKPVPNAELRLILGDSRGRRLFTSDVALGTSNDRLGSLFRAEAVIPAAFLRPETYLVSLYTFVHNQVMMDSAPDAFSFEVHDGGSRYAASEGVDYGCVFSPCRWTVTADGGALDAPAAS